MTNQAPPPLPANDSAFRTYLRAAVFLFPTVLAWSFATWFLLPKVQQLWQDAGLTTSKAQWLIEASSSLMRYSQFVFAGVVIILLLIEFLWPAWCRYRRVVIACATLLFHSAVLVGITSIAIAACVAAPVLANKRK